MIAEGTSFCGCTEHYEAAGQVCKWPTKDITYGFSAFMAAIGKERQRTLTRAAWDMVEAVCGAKFVEVAVGDKPNIVIGAARGARNNFDGPNGTLAWAYLPCGNQKQVSLMFDLDEQWEATLSNGIYYLLVCVHEGMHTAGLPHAPSDAGVNIMAPRYNPRALELGPWDRQQLELRYGPARPNQGPLTPAGDLVQLIIGGKLVYSGTH